MGTHSSVLFLCNFFFLHSLFKTRLYNYVKCVVPNFQFADSIALHCTYPCDGLKFRVGIKWEIIKSLPVREQKIKRFFWNRATKAVIHLCNEPTIARGHTNRNTKCCKFATREDFKRPATYYSSRTCPFWWCFFFDCRSRSSNRLDFPAKEDAYDYNRNRDLNRKRFDWMTTTTTIPIDFDAFLSFLFMASLQRLQLLDLHWEMFAFQHFISIASPIPPI